MDGSSASTSTGVVSTDVTPTSSGECVETTTGTSEPGDPDESALAVECLARTDATACSKDVPEGSPGRCVWVNAVKFPLCSGGCGDGVASAVCVAMRDAPETGCLCPCSHWFKASDGLYLVPDPQQAGEFNDGFCFDFPVGWNECDEDQAACACCGDDCV